MYTARPVAQQYLLATGSPCLKEYSERLPHSAHIGHRKGFIFNFLKNKILDRPQTKFLAVRNGTVLGKRVEN